MKRMVKILLKVEAKGGLKDVKEFLITKTLLKKIYPILVEVFIH
jgi:hypothetical protein